MKLIASLGLVFVVVTGCGTATAGREERAGTAAAPVTALPRTDLSQIALARPAFCQPRASW